MAKQSKAEAKAEPWVGAVRRNHGEAISLTFPSLLQEMEVFPFSERTEKRGLNAHEAAFSTPCYWILTGSKADELSFSTSITLSILQHPLNVSGEIKPIKKRYWLALRKRSKLESYDSYCTWNSPKNAIYWLIETQEWKFLSRLERYFYSAVRKIDQSFSLRKAGNLDLEPRHDFSWLVSTDIQKYVRISLNAWKILCLNKKKKDRSFHCACWSLNWSFFAHKYLMQTLALHVHIAQPPKQFCREKASQLLQHAT